MKKIILLFLYFLGLFGSFYIGYTTSYGNQHIELINKVVKEENYEFFLKFNSLYNKNQLYTSNNYFITDVYNEYDDRLELNILIKKLDMDYFKYDDKNNDNTNLEIKGTNGSINTSLVALTYVNENIFSLNISLADLLTECTDIKQLIFTYPNGEKVTEDINISLNKINKDNLTENGFTEEEYKQLFYLNDLSDITSNLVRYHVLVLCVGVSIICIIFIKKKKNI